MNTRPTPETNAAKRPLGLRACANGLYVNRDKVFAERCLIIAADRMEQLERELAEARGQRDRLAEALLKLRNNESMSLGGAAYEIVEQALQSLTPNQP